MSDGFTFSMRLRQWVGECATQAGLLALLLALRLLWCLIDSTDLESYWMFRSHVSVVQGTILNSQVCAHWCTARGNSWNALPGVVFRYGPPDNHDGVGPPEEPVYATAYTFHLPGGTHAYYGCSFSESGPLARGRVVPVEYSDDHPGVWRIASQRRRAKLCFTEELFGLAMFFTFGALFLGVGLKRSRDHSVLPHDPAFATGHLRNPSGASSVTPKFRKLAQHCSFEFYTTNGHRHEAKSLSAKPKGEWLAYIIGCNPQWEAKRLLKGQVGFLAAMAYRSALRRPKPSEPPTEAVVYDGGTPRKAYLLRERCPGVRVEQGRPKDTPESVVRACAFLIAPLLCVGGYGYLIVKIIVRGTW